MRTRGSGEEITASSYEPYGGYENAPFSELTTWVQYRLGRRPADVARPKSGQRRDLIAWLRADDATDLRPREGSWRVK